MWKQKSLLKLLATATCRVVAISRYSFNLRHQHYNDEKVSVCVKQNKTKNFFKTLLGKRWEKDKFKNTQSVSSLATEEEVVQVATSPDLQESRGFIGNVAFILKNTNPNLQPDTS